MKISVKTLKGSHFSIDVNPSDTVTTVKKQIEDLQGKEVFPSAQQILIYQGKVLKDETTLEENGVAENSFVVIMITKSKAPVAVPSSTSTSTSTSVASSVQVRPETPLPAPAPSPAPLAVGTTASPMEASATVDIATNRALGDVYGQAASNFVAGSNLQETFQQILAMGGGAWDHDSVARALGAAFNNPERAVEYLFNGIPESAEIAQGPPATATTTTAVPPVPRAGPNAAPLDLFPQGMPAATGAAAPAAASAGGLEFLLNNPQFQAIRAMVQANPQILQPLLQELERQNPQLFQMINENHGDFHRLIGEPVGSENAMLGQMAGLVPQAVDLTPQERVAQEGARLGQLAGVMPEVFDLTSQEREAVERLEAMGFNRALVIEAFFACDRNEQLAANYLLEHAGEQYD